jgi:hypothetical protein
VPLPAIADWDRRVSPRCSRLKVRSGRLGQVPYKPLQEKKKGKEEGLPTGGSAGLSYVSLWGLGLFVTGAADARTSVFFTQPCVDGSARSPANRYPRV